MMDRKLMSLEVGDKFGGSCPSGTEHSSGDHFLRIG